MNRPEMLHKRRPSPAGNVCLLLCVLFVLCLFMLLAVFRRDFFVVQVRGDSMNYTLSDGDYLYADLSKTPERGDIVIVDVTDYEAYAATERNEDGRALIIKRLIALEGDTVKCEKGEVWLRRAGETAFTRESDGFLAHRTPVFPEVTVKEGEIFVLGDNRINSYDSEDVGCLKLSDIRGVVPEWAVDHKGIITKFEDFRMNLFNKF